MTSSPTGDVRYPIYPAIGIERNRGRRSTITTGAASTEAHQVFSAQSPLVHIVAINWFNSWIDDQAELDDEEDDGFDPDRLAVCAYWRCRELFERRSANHRYCRKACRSRQNKWQRAHARKTRR